MSSLTTYRAFESKIKSEWEIRGCIRANGCYVLLRLRKIMRMKSTKAKVRKRLLKEILKVAY